MASGPTPSRPLLPGLDFSAGPAAPRSPAAPGPEGPLALPQRPRAPGVRVRDVHPGPGPLFEQRRLDGPARPHDPREPAGGPSNKRPEASHGHEGPVVSRVTARLDLARTTSSRPGPGQPPSSYLARVASARARLAAPGQGFFSFETPGSQPAPAHEEPEATRDPRPPPEEVPPAAIPSPPPTRRIESPEAAAAVLATGGEKAKARDILAAIRTLKRIEREQRPATTDERDILARFGGFGAVALSLFPDPVTGPTRSHLAGPGREAPNAPDARGVCECQADHVQRLLHLARRSSRRCTRPSHASACPEDATVLEPGCGIGQLPGLAPRRGCASSASSWTRISGRIARALYPDHDIRIENFRDTRLPEGSIDAVIGNPPFADVKLELPRHSGSRSTTSSSRSRSTP